MRGLNSASVDLIYLDPPFNSKANYAAPIGSEAAGAEFKDTWTLRDVDTEWINLIEAKHPALHRILLAAMTNSDKSYLAYMAPRLLEMHRILKPTGSIYLHCDPTMSHYLKLVMDAIWGRKAFRNEVVWCYRKWATNSSQFVRNHDVLLFYSKSNANVFNIQTVPVGPGTLKRWKGKKQQSVFIEGRRHQVATQKPAENPCPDWWEISIINPNAKERVGYPTQKPLALLERIIRASSNEGDVVLDPFCGCATTCVAAEIENRQWVGIDISAKAHELVGQRLNKEVNLGERKQVGDHTPMFGTAIHRRDIPRRTDLGKLPPYNCKANRVKLYGEQGGHCNGCEDHFKPQHFEVDHIIAKGKGGGDHIENLQLLCSNCNRIKGDRGMEYLKTKLQL
ncbi:MAG: DNA methyltransferase [Gammaproteobacteria bacterium]|nr:DNA methyltransferase [Gammaproteobacteria bacterium]